jgi:hypothetical protein
LLKTGFFRQVRELKIQRKNPSSALRIHKDILIQIDSVACAVGPSVNPLQNRETQHVNVVLQCMYLFFEQPNRKGIHSWIEWSAFKCYQVLNWFFLPKPGFLEFIWIFSGRNHFKINMSHILNPNLTT